MKNFKPLLIPALLLILVAGFFSFTNYEGDDKCKIKIIKIIDGVETVVDSTFDCDENMNMSWVSSLNHMGDSLHKMIELMMVEGDSNSFTFNIDVDEDIKDGHDVKIMKLRAGDGEEGEMKFDIQMLEEENGKMKMVINGEEIEINVDEMNRFHEHMDEVHKKMGNIEVVVENEEDGKETHTYKIIKTVDEKGNVVVKKIVDGKEAEVKEEDLEKMHQHHKMIFIEKDDNNEDITIDVQKNITIDVDVNGKDKMSKHIVIITKITKEDKAETERLNEVLGENNKDELSIDKLKFSPNPNNGRFDLSFKLNEKTPVQIKIFDMQGKEIYNENVTNFTGKYTNNIDISEYGKGVYIMQIIQGSKANAHKVIIK